MSLINRIMAAVELYCDACDYESYQQLTDEDLDYLADEQQINRAEYRELLGV